MMMMMMMMMMIIITTIKKIKKGACLIAFELFKHSEVSKQIQVHTTNFLLLEAVKAISIFCSRNIRSKFLVG